jgi:hypothetical protein
MGRHFSALPYDGALAELPLDSVLVISEDNTKTGV